MTDSKHEKNSVLTGGKSRASPVRKDKYDSAHKTPPVTERSENGTAAAGIPPESESAECDAALCKPQLPADKSAPMHSENSENPPFDFAAKTVPDNSVFTQDGNPQAYLSRSVSEASSGESAEHITDAERASRIIHITDRIVERLSEAVEILDSDDTQHMKQIVSSLSEIIDIRKQSSAEASVITVNFEGDEDYSE